MPELNRAKVIHKNFIHCVRNKKFPSPHTNVQQTSLTQKDLCDLFDSQLTSRHIDLQARKLKEKGVGYYTIGSSGHEGNAAIAKAFRATDTAFLHYRSGAFMVQRSKQVLENIDPVRDQLLSLIASIADPITSGRHKVFGSVLLHVPPQTSTIASHLPKAVGAAFSITRAKELQIDSKFPSDSVILCSFGDASVNHSTAQGALNAAQWIAHSHYPLPLVFICEDNGRGISVPTPHDWIEATIQDRPALHYIQADGLHLADIYNAAEQAAYYARVKKIPVFLHMRCVRLMGHAGSDIEIQYLTEQEIEANEFNDPLLHSARYLIEKNYLTTKEIIDRYRDVEQKVECVVEQVSGGSKLESAGAIMASIIPPPLPSTSPYVTPKKIDSLPSNTMPTKQRNLSQHINLVLHDILVQYPNTLVFGEDVAKKGGVYHVTADLMQRFGQRRVFDTILDEQTILGTAIGLAHNHFLPIPEIQFFAYLHNAEDQLRGEAATLSFFSNGQYTNPMVIRIPSFGYQKGFGGHFHNDNSIAVLRDIPGLVIACPSNGADAARLLRRCIALAEAQQRIVVFLEPIALYMTKDLHEAGDQQWLFDYSDPNDVIAFAEITTYGDPKSEMTIITYGNGYYLSRQAAKILSDKHHIDIKIIDLHWLAPLPIDAILKEVKNSQRVLIVDECRKTGSLSEALITLLVENLSPLPSIKRVTGHDSFMPLGDAWRYVLPSKEDIVEAVLNGKQD